MSQLPTLETDRLVLRPFTFARNPASGRVLAKLGMKMEGTLRQHLRKGDGYEDCVSYGILRSEYDG
jgi:RimJ/RimL family protein N-acetyltransferase